jgi:hypothetical protein
MREFGMIVAAALGSSVLGAGFGWLVGRFAPEFITLLAQPFVVKSPLSIAVAMGAIAGLLIGAGAMAVGLAVAALRGRRS